MRRVKALVFDVFGTVVDWRSGVAREVARLLGPTVGSPDIEPGAFAEPTVVRTVNQLV